MRRRTPDTPDPRPTPNLARRLSRLRRRSDVRALAKAAARLGVEAWLVGGAVRDSLLGIGDSEIDAAVSGDPEIVAHALESAGMGRAVFLSRDRPGPRVYRVAGKRPVDIAELEGGSIETDLQRRDYTVNAMAVSLGDGSVQDPFGGAADLAQRRLRPVRAGNLLDDPLRALRAARLFCTLGLKPDRATSAAARAAASGLAQVAAERIGAELARILGSPRASGAVGWAGRVGLLPATLGLSLHAPGTRRAVSTLRRFDDPGTVRLGDATRRRVRLAALALGLGFDGPGTRTWLAGRRLPRREVEDAARMVELVKSLTRRLVGREAWRWILQAGPLLDETLHIVARLDKRNGIRAAEIRRLSRRPLRRVRVTGEDVKSWLGIPAGPTIGAILADLAVAAAAGEVKTRQEARHWLTGQVRKRPPAL
jgi:tRNA nucleotidyltransferase/poly(A) polymerase